MHYAVGKKVFEDYEEAYNFSIFLMGSGMVRMIRETRQPVTHRYLGNGKIEHI